MGNEEEMILCAVGDVCVNRNNPESMFFLSSSTIKKADIAFCNLETMYSEKGTPSVAVPGHPQRAHPRNISAFTFAGFDVVSLAGNHVMDWGADALTDTIDLLERNNIRTVGAGKNIAEARKPVIIERKGIRTAFLAYNSILPHPSYCAETDKPGCAPIRVSTLYQPIEPGQPGCPARIVTSADTDDLEAMKNDIVNAKRSADLLVLSLHWGLHYTPAVLATYQREVGYAAVDAGADLIIGTHAHILKGIEIYKGKVITYSLGNFAFDLSLAPEVFETPRRKELLEFYPNRKFFEDYPSYQFPIDSRKTILLKCFVSKKGVQRVSFLPVFISNQGQPEILTRKDKKSLEVFDYMNDLCKAFGTELSFQDDEVVIHID